jgi:YHS domain-containing protein
VLDYLDPGRTRLGDPGHEDSAMTASVDPVCGMAVFTDGNPLTVVHDGTRFHFCSRACLETFMRQGR